MKFPLTVGVLNLHKADGLRPGLVIVKTFDHASACSKAIPLRWVGKLILAIVRQKAAARNLGVAFLN
jgi:hypothetical protein